MNKNNTRAVVEDDEFPVFVIVDPKLESQFGMPGGIPRINPPGMKPLLTIFTDEDLARRFCEDLRRPDVTPPPIERPQDLLAIAEHFQKSGVDEVARDISFHPPTLQTTSMASLIAALRRSCGG
jgi:hypothetical protein